MRDSRESARARRSGSTLSSSRLRLDAARPIGCGAEPVGWRLSGTTARPPRLVLPSAYTSTYTNHQGMFIPERPLIDRRRSSSRDRVSLGSQQRSRPSSAHPADSQQSSTRASSAEPSGTSTPVLLPSGQPLKSALKPSSHVHPPPRPDEDDEADSANAPASSDSLTIIEDMEGPEPGKSKHVRTGSSSSTGAAYRRRVGFDTMISGTELEEKGVNLGGGTAIKYSFTVSAKSAEFARTKWSRTFLCGTDLNGQSRRLSPPCAIAIATRIQWLIPLDSTQNTPCTLSSGSCTRSSRTTTKWSSSE